LRSAAWASALSSHFARLPSIAVKMGTLAECIEMDMGVSGGQ
jgi:hypothetical protein